MEKDGCVWADKLRNSTIIYNVEDNDDMFAETLKQCEQFNELARLHDRIKLGNQENMVELFHLTWQDLFGFIADMYIGTQRDPDKKENRIINI